MPFKGQLKRGTQVTINVSTPGTNGGNTALTLHKMTKIQLVNSEIFEIDIATVAPGANGGVSATFGTNIARIVVEVHPPTGGAATVKVTQGLNQFEDPISADATFVYDVVP